ncbi:MAG: molecular chaperone SurA [Gammaproteobacteria bacterium]|nr:molecular chaperone SurA [Gammaproteobacteria bacterium]
MTKHRSNSMAARMLGWVVALGMLAVSGSAVADYRELDGIVAIVDDDVVLASELVERVDAIRKSLKANNTPMPPDNILVSQVLERLIIENLQLQQADRRGIEIDDEMLTRAVLQFAEGNKMTLEQFQAALARDGMSYLAFREDIRKEMLITRLQRGIVNRRISVSDQEIKDLLSSPFYKEMLSDEFRVGHILLTVAQDAKEDVLQSALAKADELVKSLRDGADFKQLAIANSSASSALEGGDLGWRRAAELPSLFAEQVIEMKAGEVADPIVTQGSIHIIKLLEQRGAGAQQVNQAKVRHVLVKPSAIRTEEQTEALAWKIYEELLNKGDFEKLAAEHSEDPGTALIGGDLGWTDGQEFVPVFKDTLNNTRTGEFSKPFRSDFGWHVLQVQERRQQDQSQEAREQMAMSVLHQRRFNEELEAWQKEIRDEAFVEIRI